MFKNFSRIDPVFYMVHSPPQSLSNSTFKKADCFWMQVQRETEEMQVSGQAELAVHLLYWHRFMLLWLCCNSDCVYCSLVFFFLFLRYPCVGTRWKMCEGCLGKLWVFEKLDIDSVWLHSLHEILIFETLHPKLKEINVGTSWWLNTNDFFCVCFVLQMSKAGRCKNIHDDDDVLLIN